MCGGRIGNKIATPSNTIYHCLDVVANAIKHDTEIRGTMFGSISQTCSLERYFPEMLNSFFGARLLDAVKILTFAMSLQEGTHYPAFPKVLNIELFFPSENLRSHVFLGTPFGKL